MIMFSTVTTSMFYDTTKPSFVDQVDVHLIVRMAHPHKWWDIYGTLN